MSPALRPVLAAGAGIAAAAAFEPYAVSVLLPLAVAALTLLVRGLSGRRAFVVGTVFGGAFMLGLLPWLRVIGVDAWIALSLLEGVFYGLLATACVVLMRLPVWPLWTAAAWVGVELLRGTVPFGGFPWGRLAFAGVDTPVANLTAYVGPAGVAFVVALLGTTLAWAVVGRAPVPAAAGLAAALALALGGAFLTPAAAQVSVADTEEPTVRVAAVQGDVPGEGMNPFSERRAVLDNHVAATRDLAEEVRSTGATPPDLVIWPENSTDIDPFRDPTVYDDIQAAVDAIGVPVLVGAMVGDDADDTRVHNQGIVWEPGSGPGQRYAKTRPVPFGEYIPFRDVIARFFSRMDQIPRDMVPGTEPGLLDIGGTTIGDVICFEVAYDQVVRDVASGGARLLVVQTNNASYMGTGQIEQQFAIARLRAIETGRYVVVAATNGISGIVSPDGSVVERAPVRSRQVLQQTVPLLDHVTPGVRWGPAVEGVLVLVAVVSLTVGVGLHYRRRRRPEPVRETPSALGAASTTGEA